MLSIPVGVLLAAPRPIDLLLPVGVLLAASLFFIT